MGRARRACVVARERHREADRLQLPAAAADDLSEHEAVPVLTPPPLRAGDKVRLVSPASSTDREFILQRARILESWGLKVDFGQHAFKKLSYLAGTDEERLSDLNTAFRDPEVRAIYTTGGGKGSYRIADGIDFDAVRRDPKFLIGFSDINIL